MNKIAMGKRLRELRIEHGFTGDYVSKQMGFCHRVKVSQYERGDRLHYLMIKKFCEFYKFSLNEMLAIGKTKKNTDNCFSALLKNEMKKNKLSNKDLSKKLNICIETCDRWINGFSFPKEKSYQFISDTLNFDAGQLWEMIENEKLMRFHN